MDSRDRDILERAVRSIYAQATKTNDLIDEAMDAGLAADHPVTIVAKMLRLELLKTEAELDGANSRGHDEALRECSVTLEYGVVRGGSAIDTRGKPHKERSD